MRKMSRKQIEFGDVDWWAVDVDGFIGQFTSNGSGRVPLSIALNAEAYDVIREYFDGCEPVTFAKLLTTGEDFEVWEAIAKNGLFAFDCPLNGGEIGDTYLQIAKPIEPLKLTAIPNEISALLLSTTIDGRFADMPSLLIPRTPELH